MDREELNIRGKSRKHLRNGIQDWRQTPELVDVVLVDDSILCEAEAYVSACEYCNVNANLTFDYLLDELMGCDPTQTEYLMRRPARCRRCDSKLTEKTLIVP